MGGIFSVYDFNVLTCIFQIHFYLRYNRCNIVGSLNIPFSNVLYGENKIENIGQHSNIIKNSHDKITVIIGNEETDLELVSYSYLWE